MKKTYQVFLLFICGLLVEARVIMNETYNFNMKVIFKLRPIIASHSNSQIPVKHTCTCNVIINILYIIYNKYKALFSICPI